MAEAAPNPHEGEGERRRPDRPVNVARQPWPSTSRSGGGGGGDEKVEKRLPEIRIAQVEAEKESLFFYTHRSAVVKGSLPCSVL